MKYMSNNHFGASNVVSGSDLMNSPYTTKKQSKRVGMIQKRIVMDIVYSAIQIEG
jgi:hypothetical protein